jgi:uncharacterized membrane protein
MRHLLTSAKARWPLIALVASLILNGFLIGMAMEAFRGHRGARVERVIGFELRRFAERLPRDATRKIAAKLEPLGPQLQPRFDKLRAMRGDVDRLLAEPVPDRAAIEARLASVRSEASALQADVQQAVTAAVLALPPEQRKNLADPDRD